jgi:hypothetical protein
MRCTVPLEQQALLHASGSCSCIRFAGGSVANSPQVLLENKLKRNLNHELPRRPGQQSGDRTRENERRGLRVIEGKIPPPDYVSLDRL